MGIAVSALPKASSSAVTIAYTAIALVFFFGLGLAGGTAYKLLAEDDFDQPQVADQFTPPERPTLASNPANDAALPMAHLTPTAPPALTPPPAPTSLPPSILATPTVPTPTVQAARPAEPVAPAPVPYAQVMPAGPSLTPDTAAAAPSVPAAPAPRSIAQHRAPPPKKPHVVAKAEPAAPVEPAMPAVALRPPPAAPANVSGPFRVQFGAFANEDNARRMQWAVEATGLKVEVTQAPGTTGQTLYYLRSPVYPDYASALSAAQTVQSRVQHFVNAIPVDYAILGDHAAIEQQASNR